jgi:hypothetical protein
VTTFALINALMPTQRSRPSFQVAFRRLHTVNESTHFMLSRALMSSWSAVSSWIKRHVVLGVKHDMRDDYGDNGETQNVQPTPVLTASHPISRE